MRDGGREGGGEDKCMVMWDMVLAFFHLRVTTMTRIWREGNDVRVIRG